MVDLTNIFAGLTSLERIIITLFLVIALWIFSNFLFLVSKKILYKKMNKHNAFIFSYLIQYITLGLLIYFGIYRFLNKDLSSLVTSLGIFSLAIAFSLQQILQNSIAGIIITIQRPIEIDDWVDVGPGTGVCKVKEIKFMRTILRDLNGKLNSIPNSMILSSKLINYSQSGFVENSLQIAIPYTSDKEKIEKIILDVLISNKRILPNVSRDEGKQVKKLFKIKSFKELFSNHFNPELFSPKVYITAIAYPKITLEMKFWIREINKKEEIVSEILSALNKKLQDEKIAVV